MNSRNLKIGIIIVIIIIAGLIVMNNHSNNSNITNSNLNGKVTKINEYKCMIPKEYQNGNVTNYEGYSLYGTDNDTLYITVYNNDNGGDTMYNGDWAYFAKGENNIDKGPTTENRTLNGHDIVYVALKSEQRGEYRLAFFDVKGKRIMIEWLGNDINPSINNIINSFYALN